MYNLQYLQKIPQFLILPVRLAIRKIVIQNRW